MPSDTILNQKDKSKNHKSNKFACVIGLNDTIKEKQIILNDELILNTSCINYAYILHDPDDDNAYYHYHIVLEFDYRLRKDTLINKLSKILDTSIFNVSVRFVDSINYAYRYLIHFDSKEKKQYSIDLVHTNNLERYNSYFIDINNQVITCSELMTIVYNSSSYGEIIARIGLVNFRQNYYAIKCLYDEKNKL